MNLPTSWLCRNLLQVDIIEDKISKTTEIFPATFGSWWNRIFKVIKPCKDWKCLPVWIKKSHLLLINYVFLSLTLIHSHMTKRSVIKFIRLETCSQSYLWKKLDYLKDTSPHSTTEGNSYFETLWVNRRPILRSLIYADELWSKVLQLLAHKEELEKQQLPYINLTLKLAGFKDACWLGALVRIPLNAAI
jgi:hypothetical protein